MINAVQNINADIQSSMSGFKTQLDADGKRHQQTIIEFAKKVTNEKEKIDDKEIKVNYVKFENEVKSFLKEKNLAIEFAIDNETKKMVMKLIDEGTKEIIKQFPSDVSLHIARMLSSTLDTGKITNAKI